MNPLYPFNFGSSFASIISSYPVGCQFLSKIPEFCPLTEQKGRVHGLVQGYKISSEVFVLVRKIKRANLHGSKIRKETIKYGYIIDYVSRIIFLETTCV